MPEVSVIMPTFNSAEFVEQSINSIRAQTFTDWELLIVDDCSTDDTVSRINAIRDPRIKMVVLNSNCGPAVARNTAIQRACGRFIAFLDADDLWFPAKLDRQLEFMSRRDSAFSYAAYDKIDETGSVIGQRHVPASTTYHQLLADNVIGCLTAMYDTRKCGKVEMPLIRKRQDLGLWLRLAAKCERIDGLQEVLAQYRIRKGSVSSNKLVASRYTWRLYRHIEQLPLPKALWYFSRYAIGGLLKS